MKPRLFVGSSVESVNIAYAAQQNLHSAAEVTVWDQGIFQLSITALESLLQVLDTCDFGMFVFSPEDVVRIRGEENRAVRDNVIFELGLFVGALGRERCFILVPDNSRDLHVPTDLIGMTPATFETDRTDGSFQAATAPACHTIRETIERTGLRPSRATAPKRGPKSQDESEEADLQPESSAAARKQMAQNQHSGISAWLDAFMENDYARAAQLLAERLAGTESEEERANLESWLGRAKYHLNHKDGTQYLDGLTRKFPKSEHPYIHLANAHMGRDLFDEAMEVIRRGLERAEEKSMLVQAKARCLSEMGRDEDIEGTLRQAIAEMPDNADLYVALAEHYSERGDGQEARSVLEEAAQQLPDNESVLARYATELEKLPGKKLSLIPYSKLVRMKPEASEYLTLRANAFLELDLNDLAMRDYKRANELAGGRQGWILANIGNLLKNRGFYRDGIDYFKQAIEIEPESQYALERLAVAIKLRDEEEKKSHEIAKEARRELASLRLKKEGSQEASQDGLLPKS